MSSYPRLLLAASAGLGLTLAPVGSLHAQEGPETSERLSLTLYQSGFGLVHDRRAVELPAGEVSIRLENLARQAERESLHLSASDVRVLEQRPGGGDLGYRALLEAYVGEVVQVRHENPVTGETEVEEARLLSIDEGPVLEFEDRIETELPGRIVFPELPEGLSRAPYLEARLAVEEAGVRPLDLWYLTEGLSWRADYTALLDSENGTLSLNGRASLRNDSGGAFPEAEVSLVAGDVNRARPVPPPVPMMRGGEAMMSMSYAADAASAEASGGYYRYSLERPVSLAEGAQVQVPLVSAESVAFERRYRVEGLAHAERRDAPRGPQPAQMRLVIENSEAAGLGQPLPAGTLRVFGGEDRSMLLGEATIEHTPVDGRLDVILGGSFDVQAEGRETAFERLGEGTYETAREIRLTNAGGEAVEVNVAGAFPQGWRMVEESHPHEPESATRPVWTLEVPAGGESLLSYRVRVER